MLTRTLTNFATSLLDEPFIDNTPIPENLWGFGGLQGGLALAMATRAMSSETDNRQLRSVTGQFLRPTRANVAINTEIAHAGRNTEVRSATITSGGSPSLRATAIFGAPAHTAAPTAPNASPTAAPLDNDVFELPVELVPFGQAIEIRPTTANRPYAGAATAELRAWIRLRDDDTPIELYRLIMLVDALAPSYAATLTDFLVLPTIELTVRPGNGLSTSDSPWALIHATSSAATSDGWIDERIEAFTPSGTHLGSAQQLRMLKRP